MRNLILRWPGPLALVGFIAAILTLAACQPLGAESSDAGDLPAGSTMREWMDPSTGCIYYIYHHSYGNASTGGITAKLRDDGTPKCSGNEPSKEEVVISP